LRATAASPRRAAPAAPVRAVEAGAHTGAHAAADSGAGVAAADALRHGSGPTATTAAPSAAPPPRGGTAAAKLSWAAVLASVAPPPLSSAAAAPPPPPAARRLARAARIAPFQHASARKRLAPRAVLFKLLTGHYMVDLYLTSHDNIKAAFSTLGVVSTLLLAVGLTLFLAPLQGGMWAAMVKTQYALAICSGWAMLNNLLAILLCLAVLSLVSHIPEERGVLAAFVQAHRGFFTAPIMLAGSSVCVLVMAFVACAYAMYGPYVALLGFSSVIFWLMWLLTVSLRMLNTVWHHDYQCGGDDVAGEEGGESGDDDDVAGKGGGGGEGGGEEAAAEGVPEAAEEGRRRRRRGVEGGGSGGGGGERRRGGGSTAAGSGGGGGGGDDDGAARAERRSARKGHDGRRRGGGDKIGDTPLLLDATAPRGGEHMV
jgi:hypothetical protein